ncbi:MAG TPA: DNA-directed RNA polymerase subunit omega [Thermoanaerobaculia bacterium]|nr:DNA-directed RNA polymerase subunit omega [Thermoanaerobaculia bacterium]
MNDDELPADQRAPGRVDSKFRFVLVAAQRAEQLMRGARPKAETGKVKPTRIAMAEITEDLVDWNYGPAPAPEPAEPAAEGAAEGAEVH